jgi:hypothetical protein
MLNEEYLGISDRDIRTTSVKILAVVILATAIYFVSGAFVEAANNATRADLSQHVSNKPCGPVFSNNSCPGQLKCYSDFDESRVDANIAEPRCVTPTYEDYYCGIFEASFGESSIPPTKGTCVEAERLPHEYIMKLLWEESLYDRMFDTNQNGTKRIHEYGLKLANEEPKVGHMTSELDISLSYDSRADQLTIEFMETPFNQSSTGSLSVITMLSTFDPNEVVLRSNGTLHNTTYIAGSNESALNLPLEGKQVTIVEDGKGVPRYTQRRVAFRLLWNNGSIVDRPIVELRYANGTWKTEYPPFGHN